MRLRERPLKLLALIVLATVGMVLFGLGLLDGEVALRRHGHLTAGETPVRFAMVIFGYVACCVFVIFGWFVVKWEWSMNYRPPRKPSYDDPERRRSL